MGADNQGLSDLNVVAMSVQPVAPYDVLAVTYDGKGFWATIPPAGKLTPTFTGLTPSQSIAYSTPSITLGGTLKAGSTPATGSVSITLNNVTQTAAIQSDGTFSSVFNTLTLAVTGSPYAVTYSYAATANFNAASDSSTAVTVNQDATATKVSSSVSPSVYGQAVTFTATVAASSPGTGSPTGAVTFEDGSATLGTGSLSTTNGVTTASFSTAGLSVSSSHSIKAVYSGDPNFTTSTSSPLAQAVNQAATTTALAFSPANPTYGQSVTFTATVAASSPGRVARPGRLLSRTVRPPSAPAS